MHGYIPLETWMPAKHPLRKKMEIPYGASEEMNRECDAPYPPGGRPGVPPVMPLKTLFVQIAYGIRGERLLRGRIDFNFLYTWFVGLKTDARRLIPPVTCGIERETRSFLF